MQKAKVKGDRDGCVAIRPVIYDAVYFFGIPHEGFVFEVSDVDQALYGFTGKKFGNGNYTFDIDNAYEKTMSELAYQLCNRSNKLIDEIDNKYNAKQNETMRN